jgi:hypothetical protein
MAPSSVWYQGLYFTRPGASITWQFSGALPPESEGQGSLCSDSMKACDYEDNDVEASKSSQAEEGHPGPKQ